MSRIRITTKDATAEAELDDSQTARAILSALPIESKANRWGEEVYFSTQLKIDDENSKEVVQMGDVGFWPPGRAICIFFGRTPASKGNEIRPASPVNVFGKILGEPKVFAQVRDGVKIRVEATEGRSPPRK
jgi:hypothetical protein